MNVLVDSHCLLWWLADMPMSDGAKKAIADSANTVYVSPASIWELEIKAALGKIVIEADLVLEVDEGAMSWLPITAAHARGAARLPMHHRDPFDRMLIAQASQETCTLVSRDAVFSSYGVALIMA